MANLVTRKQRTAVLSGMLIGLVLTIATRERLLDTPSESQLGMTVLYEAHELPTLLRPRVSSIPKGNTTNFRDPFSYPPIQRAVVKSPPIDQPEPNIEPLKQGRRPTGPHDSGQTMAREYIGYVGPFHQPFAVFRLDGEIELALPGQTLDGGVVLRSFNHLEAVFATIDGEKSLEISIPVADN